jgi:hypothetical protein
MGMDGPARTLTSDHATELSGSSESYTVAIVGICFFALD